MDINLEHYRKLLKARKKETEEILLSAKDSTQIVELDQQSVGRLSRMGAIQKQEMALAAERRRKEELVQIETALKRIESGDYGYCVNCDEPIAPKRLEFNPTIMTCIACARGEN